MTFSALADLMVAAHVAFVAFVGLGGLLVWRRPGIARYHLPALAWGAGSIAGGFECPLTGLEKWLLRAAGEDVYRGGFVDRYLEDVLYPDELTPVLWLVAGAVTLLSYLHRPGAGAMPRLLGRPTTLRPASPVRTPGTSKAVPCRPGPPRHGESRRTRPEARPAPTRC